MIPYYQFKEMKQELAQQFLQYLSISPKIYLVIDTNHGAADETWFLQHQID